MSDKDSPAPADGEPAQPATIDQDALDVIALAQGVLARDFRPRAATIRRLAEEVLAAQDRVDKARKKQKRAEKKAASRPARKSGKNRKLARIPGQDGKKKG